MRARFEWSVCTDASPDGLNDNDAVRSIVCYQTLHHGPSMGMTMDARTGHSTALIPPAISISHRAKGVYQTGLLENRVNCHGCYRLYLAIESVGRICSFSPRGCLYPVLCMTAWIGAAGRGTSEAAPHRLGPSTVSLISTCHLLTISLFCLLLDTSPTASPSADVTPSRGPRAF